MLYENSLGDVTHVSDELYEREKSELEQIANKQNIVFFLGAGASVEAGVPTTVKFVDDFENSLKERDKNLYDLFLKIKNNLDEEVDKEKLDIERLLEAMEILSEYIKNPNNFPIKNFIINNKIIFEDREAKNVSKLTEKLRAFIRERTVVVDGKKVDYLHPILEIRKPSIIFSVNYDTCIETLSLRNKLKYTDGFGIEWEEERLEEKNEKFDIYLYKIHGSIMWYETNYLNYVKIPVWFPQEESDKIELMTGEIAEPFILYPSPLKWKYNKILDFLRRKLRENLRKADVCVVIGYSFRDDDILEIFEDAAKNNEKLKILLISPSAGKIHKKLEFIDGEIIPSQIYDKVIPVNHPASKVLENNYLYDIITNKIPKIKYKYNQANIGKLEGDYYFESEFKTVTDISFEIGDVITIEKVFSRDLGISPPEDWGNFEEKERFEISFKLFFLYLLNANKKRMKFIEYSLESLKKYLETGNELFDLYLKNQSSDDEELRKEIEALNNKFDGSYLHMWSLRYDDLPSSFTSLKSFLSKEAELGISETGYTQLTVLLKNLSSSLEKFIFICNIRYKQGKYLSSEIIKINGKEMELERKKDLEKALEGVINSLEKIAELK